jgi:hypothetical protein
MASTIALMCWLRSRVCGLWRGLSGKFYAESAPITERQDRLLTTTGFCLAYIGVMAMLVSFTSPHLDGFGISPRRS